MNVITNGNVVKRQEKTGVTLRTNAGITTDIFGNWLWLSSSYTNPYKSSVLFVGHGQTVQTQIRRRRTRRLIRVSTVYLHNIQLILEYKSKIPPTALKNGLDWSNW